VPRRSPVELRPPSTQLRNQNSSAARLCQAGQSTDGQAAPMVRVGRGVQLMAATPLAARPSHDARKKRGSKRPQRKLPRTSPPLIHAIEHARGANGYSPTRNSTTTSDVVKRKPPADGAENRPTSRHGRSIFFFSAQEKARPLRWHCGFRWRRMRRPALSTGQAAYPAIEPTVCQVTLVIWRCMLTLGGGGG